MSLFLARCARKSSFPLGLLLSSWWLWLQAWLGELNMGWILAPTPEPYLMPLCAAFYSGYEWSCSLIMSSPDGKDWQGLSRWREQHEEIQAT
jgi:hypothetical protein